MNICICTTPIRPIPTTYPPFGSMAIIQSLRRIGEDAQFYNIDYFRYSHEQIKTYFRENKFDLVGISAVVSTAYKYTKYLSNLIRSVSSDTKIIVGGNLAASSEILLRKCKVDICVTGDGEITIQNLVKIISKDPLNYEQLKATQGICFLDEQGKFNFTGYGIKPTAEEIEWPDYSILEADGSLPHFITDTADSLLCSHEDSILSGKKMATIVMAKGCVARCTFCHRWEKGYRVRPSDQIIEHVKYLKEHYNVGYLMVADENFGADRRKTRDIVDRLGTMDVKWMVCGVRARTVDKESLQHWNNNGCVSVLFGIESGSRKILKIMEKNATVEENINALKWADEAGFSTIIQLVLGMPGETDETIMETIDFVRKVIKPLKGRSPSESISINYAQALPGTPLYEYGREHGLIGRTIDEEEKYLIMISDTDAYREDHFINNTNLPLLKVLIWRSKILAYLDADFYRKEAKEEPHFTLTKIVKYYIGIIWVNLRKRMHIQPKKEINHEINNKNHGDQYDIMTESGYFNIHGNIKFTPLLFNPVTRRNFHLLLAIAKTIGTFRRRPFVAIKMFIEYVLWNMGYGMVKRHLPEKSLRKIITIKPTLQSQDDMMIPLRKGR